MKDFISVIIPLYNKEKYILRSVNSVLNQTYRNFELIIVNDGSTDDSIKIINKISDNRIRIINQQNSGVSVARNNGVLNSKYNLIAFLDADDEWQSDFLETVLNLKYKYSDAKLFATGYMRVEKNNIIINPFNGIPNKEWEGYIDLFKCSFKNMIVTSSSVLMYKNILYDIGGFPEGVKYGEDQYVWYQIALKYKIAFSNKVCVKYYRNTGCSIGDQKIKREFPFIKESDSFLKLYNIKGKRLFYFKEYIYKEKLNYAEYSFDVLNDKTESLKLLSECKKTKLFVKKFIKLYIKIKFPKLHRVLKKVKYYFKIIYF
ncbi:Glycosyltransferase involved in cell wall bisynthesis [Caloramator quimbayensis]|uniref:Glycosyltransferase involved in cell wall bisynthesis n=1 Tax=Caloramator quimbayensis TaxID=1147123 RepID=A0A1T4XHI7_9CLOT|nr:glycosyltransferase family 2 protein [Caloramator quimbayensis]SKA88581.1 Glycosyltransferase involved in cell wall bisynthesis [Caloramator quimbayensis]